jgi:hypothetical protein
VRLQALSLESRLLLVSLEQLTRGRIIPFFCKALKLALETAFGGNRVFDISPDNITDRVSCRIGLLLPVRLHWPRNPKWITVIATHELTRLAALPGLTD